MIRLRVATDSDRVVFAATLDPLRQAVFENEGPGIVNEWWEVGVVRCCRSG